MHQDGYSKSIFHLLLKRMKKRKRSKITSCSASSTTTAPSADDLPVDIVHDIVLRLSLKDYARFVSVCRRWRHFLQPGARPMCLMLLRRTDGACNVLDPSSRTRINYDAEFPELVGSNILSSKDGWLLLVRRTPTHRLFLFNLATRERSDLPYNPRAILSAAFSSPSHSAADCTVVILDDLGRLLTWRPAHVSWKIEYWGRIKRKTGLVSSARRFHCLGADGKLGTFDAADGTWSVHEVPAVRAMLLREGGGCRTYLAVFDGGLYAVFVSARRRHVRVFKVDRCYGGGMKELQMLGNRTIYVSAGAAHMAMAPAKEMGNRVYFPTMGSNRGSMHYYCMTKRRYSYSVDFVMPKMLRELSESSIERVWIDLGWNNPQEFEQFGR